MKAGVRERLAEIVQMPDRLKPEMLKKQEVKLNMRYNEDYFRRVVEGDENGEYFYDRMMRVSEEYLDGEASYEDVEEANDELQAYIKTELTSKLHEVDTADIKDNLKSKLGMEGKSDEELAEELKDRVEEEKEEET